MVIVPHEEVIERISPFVLKAFLILKYYTLTKINKENKEQFDDISVMVIVIASS